MCLTVDFDCVGLSTAVLPISSSSLFSIPFSIFDKKRKKYIEENRRCWCQKNIQRKNALYKRRTFFFFAPHAISHRNCIRTKNITLEKYTIFELGYKQCLCCIHVDGKFFMLLDAYVLKRNIFHVALALKISVGR